MIGKRRGGRELQPVAEINVTSMVDVAFTLLIIFIITAPILQGGIEVAVPQTEVSALTAESNSLIITIDRDSQIYLGETPVDPADFPEAFAQIVAGGLVDDVVLKADSLATWGVGIDVVGIIQANGFPVKVVAEQRPGR
ncbi:MAG TPA: biopolymer transporter ExbD [Gemmatimonadetes bacterium]|nr:biopolymer transporter ExbD [Gemmatimonadota bacterium]